MTKQRQAGTFPGSSVVKTSLSNARVKILSLVGELRFHLPHGQKTKTENRSNIVTNSIKALKYGQHQKKKKKNLENRRSTEEQSKGRAKSQSHVVLSFQKTAEVESSDGLILKS